MAPRILAWIPGYLVHFTRVKNVRGRCFRGKCDMLHFKCAMFEIPLQEPSEEV